MTRMPARERHPYVPDPAVPADESGYPPCLCRLAKGNERHQLPETPPEARDRDASILGEKEDDL